MIELGSAPALTRSRQPSGRPTLELHGATQQHAERLGVRQISISITHSGNTAFAEVIFEN